MGLAIRMTRRSALPNLSDGAVSPRQQLRATLALSVALALLAALVATAYLLYASPGRGATAALSLAFGATLGIVFERGRFCYFCILRDGIEFRNSGPLYAILAALAVGTLGYTLVMSAFLPSPFTGRLPAQAHIGPLSWALGLAGLLFGIGMALSGACISGHLYRLGEGSGRAPFALVGAICGFGLGLLSWNTLYVLAIADGPVVWLPAHLGYGGALAAQLGLLAILGLVLLRGIPELPARAASRISLATVRDTLLGTRWPPLVTGAIVGALGVVAYLRVEPLGVTSQLGSLARTALDQGGLLPEQLNGLDALAGCATVVVQTITDNGLLVSGLVAGSLAAALAAGRFRPAWPTAQGAASAWLGGLLQGWGALIALGCTVGTLLSGISAGALSGWVFALAVVAGVWLGIKLRLHRWE
jgi:uncharacterized protein